MLKVTALDSKGMTSGGAGMLKYLKETEYYKDKDGNETNASRWLGKGADALMLHGSVAHEDMDALAAGRHPDGHPLCQNAGQAGRRVGYDLTFSAPKSVSVLYAAADATERERILDVQRAAVAEAMGYIESQAVTRRGKGGVEKIPVKGLVASGFTHFASRDLDPQLHEHVLVYNVAQGEDGKWSTFDNSVLAEQQRAAGAIYRASLALKLQQLGYGIEKQVERDADGRATGQVYFGVAGVGEKVQHDFSQRRQAIEAYMAKHDVSAQAACLATRKAKEEPSYDELTKTWEKTLDEMRQSDPDLFASAQALKGMESQVGSASDEEVLSKLHATEAVFTRSAVVERIALESVGYFTPAQIEQEADRLLNSHAVVRLVDLKGTAQYTSRKMIEAEQDIVKRAEARKEDKSVRVAQEKVDQAIQEFEQDKGSALTPEQRAAVNWVCTGTGGTACITGFAGTGKTFSALAFKKAFEADGRRLIGVAIAWDAAKKLQAETGMESHSAASIMAKLENGKLKLTSKDVVVLDEAGMAGTATVHALQKACDRAGAKLVMQGDVMQLQPVEAGGAFRLAIKAVQDAKLTDIRRQRNAEDRKTARLFYGLDENGQHRTGKEVFDRLKERGQVHESDYAPGAIKALVKDYFTSKESAREKLVLGGTRSNVKRLNEALRAGFQERGLLGESRKVEVIADGEKKTIELATGDRVRLGEKDDKLGVWNGAAGVVEKLTPNAQGGFDVAVKLESEIAERDGQVVEFNTKAYDHLDHCYARTVYKSQGQGINATFEMATPNMTNLHSALVSFTRTKETYGLYGAKDDLAAMQDRFVQEQLKTNASDLMRPDEKAQAAEQAKEAEREATWMQRLREVAQRIGDKIHGREQAQTAGPAAEQTAPGAEQAQAQVPEQSLELPAPAPTPTLELGL